MDLQAHVDKSFLLMLLLMPLKYWFEIIFPFEVNLHEKKAKNKNLFRLSKHMLLEMNVGHKFPDRKDF